MGLFLLKISIGAAVGFFVALTGLGGGLLLLPILIFALGVTPIVAIGSDAAFNALTRIAAGCVHWKRGSVDGWIISNLCIGSVPGVLIGALLIIHLQNAYGNRVNDILRIFIGVLLVFIPLLLLFQKSPPQCTADPGQSAGFAPRIAVVGVVSGIIVGISSVGSGTIVMILLAVFARRSPLVLIGTDLVHAVILTGLASVFYIRAGNVQLSVVLPLLIGSLPGALIGARLAYVFPAPWLKRVLFASLIAAGARMLWL
jgi:uncharacterized protein